MNLNAEFDIIVFGASGFTGRLVTEHLMQEYGNGGEVAWAMAGRSLEELAEARDSIGAPADTPLVIADAADPASLRERPYSLPSGPTSSTVPIWLRSAQTWGQTILICAGSPVGCVA
jgi:hypothetical protein